MGKYEKPSLESVFFLFLAANTLISANRYQSPTHWTFNLDMGVSPTKTFFSSPNTNELSQIKTEMKL